MRAVKEFVVDLVRSFLKNDLLSYASAVAFQVVYALVPLTLAAVALLGFLNLEEVWSSDVAPRAREQLRPDSYSVLERTVDQILGEKRGLWLTVGLAVMLWAVSGAVRATIVPFNHVYGCDEDRPLWRRLLVSFALAAAIVVCVLVAAAAIQLGPRLAQDLDGLGVRAALFVLRWLVAVGLLLLAVALLIALAPSRPPRFRWTTVGSFLVVFSWIAVWLVFGWYASAVADYTTLFGNLASVIILLILVYISAVALLFGVQVDALLRARADESSAGGLESDRKGDR